MCREWRKANGPCQWSSYDMDTPSLSWTASESSAGGALLSKVMLIPRPCLYPQAAAARGDVLGLIGTQMLQTTVWTGERAGQVFGGD